MCKYVKTEATETPVMKSLPTKTNRNYENLVTFEIYFFMF
jgi:hypothetical protein